jgi:hypothetical protein
LLFNGEHYTNVAFFSALKHINGNHLSTHDMNGASGDRTRDLLHAM